MLLSMQNTYFVLLCTCKYIIIYAIEKAILTTRNGAFLNTRGYSNSMYNELQTTNQLDYK